MDVYKKSIDGKLTAGFFIHFFGGVGWNSLYIIHPRSLTARPRKMMVGRLLSFWGFGVFSGANVLSFQGSIQSFFFRRSLVRSRLDFVGKMRI